MAIENRDVDFISQYVNSKKDIEFYRHDGFTPLSYSATRGAY